MNTQHLIKQTLSRPESVVVVQQILEDHREASRTAEGVRVCEECGFFNALGKVQTSGCLQAPRELQQAKRLQLPAARESARHSELRRQDSPVEAPDDLPASVEEIRELELIRVETESAVRIWNELMRLPN
ncbi:MAG: hypothetical protein ACRERU_01680 [Methylococcales bacterium]